MPKQEQKYPGPEGFWRTSPELIDMQGDLEDLWKRLEGQPALTAEEIKSLKPSSIVALKRSGQDVSGYNIFEIDAAPSRQTRNPGEQYSLHPRESNNVQEQQVKIHLDKFPGGYRIEGSPVQKRFDNNELARIGVHAVKQLSHPAGELKKTGGIKFRSKGHNVEPSEQAMIYDEAVRQAALKELNRYKRLKKLEEENGPEWKNILAKRERDERILGIVKNAVGEE